jgi:xanthine/CO dehydrogenase XdhC/CoxF family maturation factor|uniref:Uncharacterized protein n=1 Tax=viral metagenome TaxID=1070528 RepID=A0A6C0BQ16_9ZZZZ
MSFVTHIHALKQIYMLFSDIHNVQIRNAFIFKLNFELDKLVNLLDKTYYEATVMNNRKILTKIHNERNYVIMNTHDTLSIFMPYVIAFNLVHGV